ncbi:MAG: glucose/galactose MFS transporter, partial [Alphaproteobacteria bacterium]|nr:glucose/galactose MFS transporter [Alphaproteobacteria bacterium]
AIEGLGPLTERGSGLLIMAIAGGAVLPLVQGALADVVGLKLALLAPTVAYIYILGYAVFAGGSQSTSMPQVAEEIFSA